MPFIYDYENLEEPGEDIFRPRVDQFFYLPAPEYNPARQPVRFSISPVEPSEPEAPVTPASPRAQIRRRSLMDILLGRNAASIPHPTVSSEDRRRQQRLQAERCAQQLFSIVVPVLKAAGVRRVYCRYDGGSDEGFAWFDRYEMENGARVDDNLVGQNLRDMKIDDQLVAAKLMYREPWPAGREAEMLGRSAASMLATEWASILLGASFGTGEYLLYGAFMVDLEECSITDDPGADPIVENITIVR
jgi:hypothetical protein